MNSTIGHQYSSAGYAATIGFFDGVHTGHRYVISQLRQVASRCGLPSMVVTFDRHPREVVHSQWQPQFLTTLDEKVQLLRQAGVDRVEVLPFDHALSQLTARDFMDRVLRQRLGVSVLLTGYDNHFGHRAAGSTEGFADYQAYGKLLGIDVVAGQPLVGAEGVAVSSSMVRRLLAQGLVEEAAHALGRHYSISGTVEHGHEVGRSMGFPTANLAVQPRMMVPADGVYAVKVSIDGSDHGLLGVTNIGTRPTFDPDAHTRTIETHILDYAADLYGRRLRLEFIARLRAEQRFPSRQALARQMADDIARAKSYL